MTIVASETAAVNETAASYGRTSVETKPRAVVLRRVFRAPPTLVFEAFTKPAMLREWWGHEETATPVAEVDLRIGGAYRFEMEGMEGGPFTLAGEFRIIERPRKLAYTWNWVEGGPFKGETLVTLEFRDHADGTELVLTHEGFDDPNIRDQHDQGWSSAFNSLDHYLEKGDPK